MRMHTAVTLVAIVALTACTSSVIDEPTKDFLQAAETTTLIPSIIETITPTEELEEKEVALDYAFSANGDTLAVYINSKITFYDVETPAEDIFFEFVDGSYSPNGWAGAVAFSPDGTKIAFSGKFEDSCISIFDLQTKKPLRCLPDVPNGNFAYELEFGPDSKTLLIRSVYPLAARCESSQDTFTLLDLNGTDRSPAKRLYEESWCTYVPGEFRFTGDGRFVLYLKSMSPAYWVRTVDTHTGDLLQDQEFDSYRDGVLYDVSPSGATYAIAKLVQNEYYTSMIDEKTGRTLQQVKGIIYFINDTTFLVRDSDSPPWKLADNNGIQCAFEGLLANPDWKFSANHNVFAVPIWGRNHSVVNGVQIWDVASCQQINQITFNQ